MVALLSNAHAKFYTSSSYRLTVAARTLPHPRRASSRGVAWHMVLLMCAELTEGGMQPIGSERSPQLGSGLAIAGACIVLHIRTRYIATPK